MDSAYLPWQHNDYISSGAGLAQNLCQPARLIAKRADSLGAKPRPLHVGLAGLLAAKESYESPEITTIGRKTLKFGRITIVIVEKPFEVLKSPTLDVTRNSFVIAPPTFAKVTISTRVDDWGRKEPSAHITLGSLYVHPAPCSTIAEKKLISGGNLPARKTSVAVNMLVLVIVKENVINSPT